jgi:hypothetical protein
MITSFFAIGEKACDHLKGESPTAKKLVIIQKGGSPLAKKLVII